MKRQPITRREERSLRSSPLPFENDDFVHRIIKICQRLVQRGYREEVEKFLAVWRPIAERGETLRLVDSEGVTEGGKWVISFLLWDAYLEKGEQAVLARLPFLLHFDCVFFLDQRWVRELIAQWKKEKNGRQKIGHLFFGTPKKSIRSYETVVDNYQRDLKIIAMVETLLEKNCGYNEAMRIVARDLGKLGIMEKLSSANVRRIFENRDRLNAPFFSLLSLG